MNDHLTEIAFILDRSGSMVSMTEHAIAGFNEFVRDQQRAPGIARLTLVLFDDRIETVFQSVPLAEVAELDTNTFVPRGSTALLDAIGLTVDQIGERLSATREEDRPGQVIVAILTDGMENSSCHFTWQAISSKIHHQECHYSWRFLFLGANQDAIATASRMGIAATDAATYAHDEAGYRSGAKAFSRKIEALRQARLHAVLASPDLDKPMHELLREENERLRRSK